VMLYMLLVRCQRLTGFCFVVICVRAQLLCWCARCACNVHVVRAQLVDFDDVVCFAFVKTVCKTIVWLNIKLFVKKFVVINCPIQKFFF
jgi:hypothetical protein